MGLKVSRRLRRFEEIFLILIESAPHVHKFDLTVSNGQVCPIILQHFNYIFYMWCIMA